MAKRNVAAGLHVVSFVHAVVPFRFESTTLIDAILWLYWGSGRCGVSEVIEMLIHCSA